MHQSPLAMKENKHKLRSPDIGLLGCDNKSALKTEAVCSFQTLITIYKAAWCRDPKYSGFCENFVVQCIASNIRIFAPSVYSLMQTQHIVRRL